MQLFSFTNLQLIPQFKSSLLIAASSVLADSEPRVSPGFCQADWLPSPLQLLHNIFQTVVSSICFTCQLAHIHFPTPRNLLESLVGSPLNFISFFSCQRFILLCTAVLLFQWTIGGIVNNACTQSNILNWMQQTILSTFPVPCTMLGSGGIKMS